MRRSWRSWGPTTPPRNRPTRGGALTVLLPVLDARVAGDVARLLQRRTERRVQLQERARDAMLDRIRLPRQPAATDVDVHVVARGRLGELERLPQDHLGGGAAE